MQTTTAAEGELCPKCKRPKKPFERAGAQCIHCKNLARLGERDDDEPAPKLVVRTVEAAPAPETIEPPAAVTVDPPKCWRCGRISGVRTRGWCAGLCNNCENAGRMAAKRTGKPTTSENILGWCRTVKYGAAPMPRPTPAAVTSPATLVLEDVPPDEREGAPLVELRESPSYGDEFKLGLLWASAQDEMFTRRAETRLVTYMGEYFGRRPDDVVFEL